MPIFYIKQALGLKEGIRDLVEYNFLIILETLTLKKGRKGLIFLTYFRQVSCMDVD